MSLKCDSIQLSFWHIFGKDLAEQYILLDQYYTLAIYLISIGFKDLANNLLEKYHNQFTSVANILITDFPDLWDGIDNYFTISTVLLPKQFQWSHNCNDYLSLVQQMTEKMERYCKCYNTCLTDQDCFQMWQCKKSGSTNEWLRDIWDKWTLKQLNPTFNHDKDNRMDTDQFVMNIKDKTQTFAKLENEFKNALYGSNRERYSKCYVLFLEPCCWSPAITFIFQFTQACTVTIIKISRKFAFDKTTAS